jgi:hypothetical protein
MFERVGTCQAGDGEGENDVLDGRTGSELEFKFDSGSDFLPSVSSVPSRLEYWNTDRAFRLKAGEYFGMLGSTVEGSRPFADVGESGPEASVESWLF